MEKSWHIFNQYKKEQLRFATVICLPIRCDETESPDNIMYRCLESVSDFNKKWISTSRGNGWLGVRVRGYFELEIIKSFPTGISHKSNLYSSLGVDCSPLSSTSRVVVPHIHFLCGMEDPSNYDAFSDRLRLLFPGSRRVQVKRLFDSQSTNEAIQKIWGYTSKHRSPDKWRYVEGGQSGEIENSQCKFGELYESHWFNVCSSFYKILVDTDSLLFRTKL